MTKKFVPVDVVDAFLSTVGNTFFTVEFQKIDGNRRKLTGRLNVVKDLKGGDSTTAHIPEIQNLYTSNGNRRSFYKTHVFKLTGNGISIGPARKRAKTRV